jgi:hypothetical protein
MIMAGSEWARRKAQYPGERLPLDIYKQVCDEFYETCLGETTTMDRPAFRTSEAQQRMRHMLDTSTGGIRFPTINFPNTGSGGYLPRRFQKEAKFGCR